jgi:hypothetical protein
MGRTFEAARERGSRQMTFAFERGRQDPAYTAPTSMSTKTDDR